jgi:hypothetical protein
VEEEEKGKKKNKKEKEKKEEIGNVEGYPNKMLCG